MIGERWRARTYPMQGTVIGSGAKKKREGLEPLPLLFRSWLEGVLRVKLDDASVRQRGPDVHRTKGV